MYYFNMWHAVASGIFEIAFGLPTTMLENNLPKVWPNMLKGIDHLGILAIVRRIILKVKLKEITCQVEDWSYLA